MEMLEEIKAKSSDGENLITNHRSQKDQCKVNEFNFKRTKVKVRRQRNNWFIQTIPKNFHASYNIINLCGYNLLSL